MGVVEEMQHSEWCNLTFLAQAGVPCGQCVRQAERTCKPRCFAAMSVCEQKHAANKDKGVNSRVVGACRTSKFPNS